MSNEALDFHALLDDAGGNWPLAGAMMMHVCGVLNAAFNRGLDGVAVSRRAEVIFDGSPTPHLRFTVELPNGETTEVAEPLTQLSRYSIGAAIDQGAACATSLRIGLLKPRKRRVSKSTNLKGTKNGDAR